MTRLCSVEGCGRKAVARGLCGMHYQRWRKTADDSEVAVHAKAGEPLAWIEQHATFEGDECLIWPFAKYPSGYGMLNLPEGGATMASRFMCQKVHGEPPTELHQAAHRCGNGAMACMTPGHVYWATRSRNEADKVDHGTSNRGEGNGHAKITAEIVRAIRVSSEGPDALASRYGISAPTICDIRARRSWAWLK